MYFEQKERKFVQLSCAKSWHVAMGTILELYQNSHKPWGLHARIVNKKEAEDFLSTGIVWMYQGTQSVVDNLRARHRQACFLPSDLPEQCGRLDSILLIRKRESGDVAEPGFDNRYHFFLVTWSDPEQMSLELASEVSSGRNDKVVALSSRRKCDHGGKRRASSDDSGLELPTDRKRGFQKGMSRGGQKHRWRF